MIQEIMLALLQNNKKATLALPLKPQVNRKKIRK
jgi:hypothetical protein